jgi:hypothetical protein
MSNKQTIKSELSRKELIDVIGSLRTQLADWRQIAVSIAADLLIIDPKNELFTCETIQEEMVKHIIAFVAQKLDHQKEKLFDRREITDFKVFKNINLDKIPNTTETNITLDGMIALFAAFRTLQKEFMVYDKDRIASEEGKAMMDNLDIELNKLYTHFTGKEPKKTIINK